jgi:nucleotide-binding universal stress UspA family protein
MRLNILVPYDFGPAAERALAWAANLLRTAGAGSLTLLHVVSSLPPAGGVGLVPIGPSPEDFVGIETRLREAAARHGVEGRGRLLLEPTAEGAVIAEARAWPADVIVMGTHGRGAIGRALLGSVADHVIRRAECPVVTLRAEEGAS